MKVSNDQVSRLLEARLERVQRGRRAASADKAVEARPDGIALSARSQDVRAGIAAAKAAAPSDPERLAALAGDVRSGRHRPPADAVAEAVLRDLGR